MRLIPVRLATVTLILSIAACDGNSGPDFIWLRAMNAMPDAPAVRVSYENYVYQRNIEYGNSSAEGGESLLGSAGPTARLRAEYLHAGGTIGGTLLTLDVPVQKDFSSTVILAGSFAEPEAFIVHSPRLPRPLAALNVQFAHAALDLGALDVYVTAPATDLAATAPLATVQPRSHTGILEIPFGKTRMRLTSAGTLDVVMDSGELDFPASEASTGPGAQWLFTVTPSVVPGPSPVFLNGSTGRQDFRFFDDGTPAVVRAIHASPDVGAVDVVAAEETPSILYGGLEYRSRSPLVAAPVGEYSLEFHPAGGEGEAIASMEVDLVRAIEYSVFLVGELEDASMRVNDSQTRSVATEAKLRFANVAPASPFFTVYLSSTEEDVLEPRNRLVRDMRSGAVTNHVIRVPGPYFLTVTERFYASPEEEPTAEETVMFGPAPLELAGGDVWTWAFFAPEIEGEPAILQQFDDRLP
jgi:hypothetical protein